MIHVDLSPDVETRLYAQARAQGVEPESLVRTLIETAVHMAPIPPRRLAASRDMTSFFAGMAANSDKIPALPDEAFARESFYRDHD